MASLLSYMSEELRAQFEIESFREVTNQSTESPVDDGETRNDDVDNGGGVYVTWKDLWVTVSNGKKGTKAILQEITGFARPGQLLAIMGPSGCGKSTLLDALAGRLSTNAKKTGEILVNGHKQALAYGTSAYVMQDDALITTLTVREAVHYSAQLQLPSSMSAAEKAERADTTIKEMGLMSAMNTRIGGSSGGGDKGLSGGQKRRVSICLEMLTHPKLLFLDEPTSGLDSAASYYVISRIASLNQQDGVKRTIVASIHQPSSEVFQLFDSLCLMSSGRTVFFGPSKDANEFFASNGFPCPTLQNPSDHFLKTINKDFKMDLGEDQEAILSNEAINILPNAYKASAFYEEVLQQVAKICKQGAKYDHGVVNKSRDRIGFLTQCCILTRRSSVNMFRDKAYYWLRLAIYVTVSLGLGTVFYDIGSTYGSIQAKGSLLVFISSILTFMALGGFPSFVEDMKVFTRERLNGHYQTGPFVVANTVSSFPFQLLVSLFPGALAYYLPGLKSEPHNFLYLAAVLLTCMMIVESMMMIVASLVPNYLMGIIAGAGILSIMILGGGFFRLPNDLPKLFWKYPLHYIVFHTYAYQGLFKNEFENLRFQGPPGGARTIDGDQILREVWQLNISRSKWFDLGVLVGMVVVYRVMFLVIVKINEVVRPKLDSLFAAGPGQVAHVMVTHGELEEDEL